MTRPDTNALDPQAGRARSISKNMADLCRLHFGRTPGSTRTYVSSEDLVLVVLKDSMAPVEKRAVERGDAQRVREARLANQLASSDQFCNIVASATGRRVRAFTSAHDVEAEVATEAFVLHPD